MAGRYRRARGACAARTFATVALPDEAPQEVRAVVAVGGLVEGLLREGVGAMGRGRGLRHGARGPGRAGALLMPRRPGARRALRAAVAAHHRGASAASRRRPRAPPRAGSRAPPRAQARTAPTDEYTSHSRPVRYGYRKYSNDTFY